MCSALQQTHLQHVGLHTKITAVAALHTDHQTVEKSLSTVVPNMPSPQTPDGNNRKFFKFPQTRKGKLSLIVDLFIFVIVVVLIGLIEFGFFPHRQSGFYCNDPKISHKFTGDTVSMGILLATVYTTPLIMIYIVEMRACKQSVAENCRRLWFWYKEFLLGITIVILITEFAKIVIGEPRPHFLETCKPDTAMNCTAGFIPSYKCTNTKLTAWLITDSSRSFPSGHSSMSVFTALFCIWYLQRCLQGLPCKLLKPLIQTVFLSASTTCALSRIADNRHHWWDVLAGAILGFLCAIYTVVVFCKNFNQPFLMKSRPSHSTCTLLTDTTNKNATSVVL